MDQSADRVVVELEARTGNYLARMRAARRDFNVYMESMGTSAETMERRVGSASNRMSQVLGRAIAGIAVGVAIKEVGQYADAWTQSANKLSAAGVVIEGVAAKQSHLVALARDTRTEYAQTADIYARVTRSTEQLNATEYQRLRLTELINKAVKAGGATTAEQISTITQLGQAMASGNLQGDELRSIRENAPLIARAIAEEFNTTIGGLKELGAEGEITSDRVVRAILTAGDTIDAKFATTKATIGESFTALETEAIRFFGNLDKAIGASEGIRRFTEMVTQDFDLMSQAVIIAAAVAGGAIVGKLTVPLQQAAVTNAQFVRSLVNGTSSLQQQANATRAAAREVLLKTQADRDSAREGVVATQARINALRQEAVQYQQNIQLAQQQRAAVAEVASGRFRGQFVSKADQTDATAARDRSTKALIASRMQLNSVTQQLNALEAQLAAQHNNVAAASSRVIAAQTGMAAAIARTSALATAGTLAMRGLGVAMSFFGGPIGIAIMAVAAAVAYFTTEAAKAEQAGTRVREMLDETSSAAEQTRQQTDDLGKSQRDGATASGEAAVKARESASAYDTVATAASNAAEMVKYLTSQQRQQRLEKLDEAIGDAQRARSSSNPLTTNDRERLENERAALLRRAGRTNDSAVGQRHVTRVENNEYLRTLSEDPNADKKLQEAARRYILNVRTFNEEGENLRGLMAERAVILENVNAPTEEKPAPVTSNLTPPGAGSGSGGKTGDGSGRSRREETREELEARREIFDLEQRLRLQRAAGAEQLAQFTQDELDRRRIIASLEDQGFSTEDAEKAAAAYIAELRAARAIAEQRERDENNRKTAERQKEEDERKRIERENQIAFMREQELLHQRELARLAGNSERVKELDKIIDRMQRIAVLQGQGGMSAEGAADRADRDQEDIDEAERKAQVKDSVFGPVKEALLEAFRGGDWQQAFADAIEDRAAEGFSNALDMMFDKLTDLLLKAFDSVDWSGLFKGGGGGFSVPGFGGGQIPIGFGGGRAGGGLMKPGMVYNFEENGRERIMVGSTARVLPNRVESGNSGGGDTSVSLSVVNATGVPAKATVDRDENGNQRLRLEPLIDQGIQSAGRRGVLEKSRQMTPQPRRRG